MPSSRNARISDRGIVPQWQPGHNPRGSVVSQMTRKREVCLQQEFGKPCNGKWRSRKSFKTPRNSRLGMLHNEK